MSVGLGPCVPRRTSVGCYSGQLAIVFLSDMWIIHYCEICLISSDSPDTITDYIGFTGILFY